MRLLRLKFKSDNTIKSEAMKLIAKKILSYHKSHWKPIVSVVKNILKIQIQMLDKLNKLD